MPLEIDVDLARKTEKDNPVYYVQYAHARIVQAIDKARAEKGVSVPGVGEADLSLLTEDAETDLIKKLSELPNEVVLAAAEYAPQRIVQYARDLAALFHSFYDAGNRTPALRVVCDDLETMKARLVLGPRHADRPAERAGPAGAVRAGADVERSCAD